jgi:hypothetical protein
MLLLMMNNNLCMVMNKEKRHGESKSRGPHTRQDIIKAARKFQWHRQMPKWTTIVDGTELPARPLVLDAAGVPPNPGYDSYVSSTL